MDTEIFEKRKENAFSEKFKTSPAITGICCCSVTVASAFVATYLLVTYAIGLIYELVWLVESETGLPVASLLLMMCYCIIIASTIVLVHGIMTKNSKYLLAWLIAVAIVLIPECVLVFYMSLSHWGLQSVYGSAELICYVARLPALVIGIVLVQSAHALRQAKPKNGKSMIGSVSGALAGNEFDASSYVPDASYINDAFIEDSGKMTGPDIRRHLQLSRQHPGLVPILPPPPGYWPPYAQYYGTWMGPRSGGYDQNFKRRHSIVGTFDEDCYDGKFYDEQPDERLETKSEMNFPRYPDQEMRMNPYIDNYNARRYHDQYGVNLFRHDPYGLSIQRERVFYGPMVRSSYASFGEESDDIQKYKDVAL